MIIGYLYRNYNLEFVYWNMDKKLSDIYLFNPTCEFAVGNGTAGWQPNQLLQKMESDLATLPMFFANPHDYILVDKVPSSNHLKLLGALNYIPPKFILKKKALNSNEFLNLSKFAVKILNELSPVITGDFIIPNNLKPQICFNRKEIERLLLKWGKLMIKAPWRTGYCWACNIYKTGTFIII